ncbi:MAG: Uma2 family endonuclease [Methylococcaceae bacterium]|nr:Uma2 family endonuclease [Methylococcaceae bacterium]
MSRPAPQIKAFTEEQYLEMELTSPIKHEFIGGHIHAMTGASVIHNIIAGNVYIILREHLRGSPCRVFMSDVKLKVDAASAYYYPDLMVSCEPAPDSHYREQPTLIVEMLSESTSKHDFGEKRRAYQSLESPQEYMLVSQECMDVRVFRREGADWKMRIYTDGAAIPLNSMELEIPIERIYEEAWE